MLNEWLLMKEDAVFEKFASLPNAYVDGANSEKFCYVPGDRPDRVLLVSHADTVWSTLRIETEEKDGVISSARKESIVKYRRPDNSTFLEKGIGIGADDRAGCAILWQLKDLGHSLLITSGEESGGDAARFIINSKWWKNELNNKHQFMIEFDRSGKDDIVFYDVASRDFASYVCQQTKYHPQRGTFTDIRILCESLSGVNISVGYYEQHTPDEHIIISEWNNTLEIIRKWLSDKHLPQFKFDRHNRFDLSNSKKKKKKHSQFYNNNLYYTNESGIKRFGCKRCGNCYDLTEYYKNKFKCTKCGA